MVKTRSKTYGDGSKTFKPMKNNPTDTTLKGFLIYLASLIVDHPDEVNVEEKSIGENLFQYTIKVNKEDIGKVIGKEGKIIQSIRNVAKIIAIKQKSQIRIEIG